MPPQDPTPLDQVCDVSLSVSMCSHCSTPTYKLEHAALVFCSCVSLLRMMVSSFIHVPAKDMNSSFFMAAEYSMVCMCHIFFIQSIIDGHLGWFQVFAIVNSTAINICVHVSNRMIYNFGGIYLVMELLGQMVKLSLGL